MPPLVALGADLVTSPVGVATTVLLFLSVPASFAIMFTFAPTDVASHSGELKESFISSAIFCAVYVWLVSQRIGLSIILIPSTVITVIALSTPFAIFPAEPVKSPSASKLTTNPFWLVPFVVALIKTVPEDSVAV